MVARQIGGYQHIDLGRRPSDYWTERFAGHLVLQDDKDSVASTYSYSGNYPVAWHLVDFSADVPEDSEAVQVDIHGHGYANTSRRGLIVTRPFKSRWNIAATSCYLRYMSWIMQHKYGTLTPYTHSENQGPVEADGGKFYASSHSTSWQARDVYIQYKGYWLSR